MNLFLIALVTVLVIIITTFVIIRTDRETSRELAGSFSMEAVHKFNSFLIRDLVLVQKAASSSALTEWFADEEDPEKWKTAYNEIVDYIRIFSDMRFYFGILETRNEFFDTEAVLPSRFLPFSRLSLTVPDHAGYFDCINTRKGYTYSIDMDSYLDAWQLWINHRVLTDATVAGIICTRRPINNLVRDMFYRRSDDGFIGCIIDSSGRVLMETVYADIYGNEIINAINSVSGDSALIAAAGEFPKDADLDFYGDAITKNVSLKKGSYKYAAVTPIEDTPWSVAVFYNYKILPNLKDVLGLLPVFTAILAILILYVVVRNAMTKKFLYGPLNSLTQSIADSETEGINKIYGLELNDEVGELAKTISNMRDSLSKQAAEIAAANEQTQKLFNTMPICCMLWDKNCRLFDCNDETLRMFRLNDKQEFIDRFYEFSPEYQPNGERSNKFIMMLIKKTLEEGYCISKYTHQLPDGLQIQTEAIMILVTIGGEPVVSSYVRDLRDYEIMMNEIIEQDNLLNTINNIASILLQSEPEQFEKNLLGCMGMMAKVTDVDRVCIWKNYSVDGRLYCAPLYEWPESSRMQQPSASADMFSYADFPGWEKKLSEKQSINTIIANLPPGERRIFEAQGVLSMLMAPVFLDEKFWGFVSFDELHYERLFAENKESILRSGNLLIATSLLRNEMTTNLRSASIQLESALEKASRASQAKSEFLANMSHEMRTPLNAVIGLTQLTLETERLNEEARENLDKIYSAGTSLLSTVNDILDISKIEAGKLELIPAEYDLSSMINDVVTQSNIYIGEKAIEFELDITEDLPAKLFGDELRIKQICNNLLSNACKYTKEGKVTLKIRCRREIPEGDSGGEPETGIVWMTATVSDTGIGIKTDDLNRLFTDYTQMETDSNRKIEGTGLGLSIVRKEVQMMSGAITVESEYGKGSIFTITIQQKHVSDDVIGADVVSNLKSFRYTIGKQDWNSRQARIDLSYAQVLVVDDNATNLDVAKGLLNLYGIRTDCVISGQDAIDTIRRETIKYNAIFMDHMMPGMDGIEATRIIREEVGTDYAKNIPIIALTANAIVGNEELFLNKGFQAFISKPIEIDRLDQVIRQWVRDKELEKILAGRRILAGGRIRTDMRRRKERRSVTDRRSGVDRRTFGKVIPGIDMEKGVARFGHSEDIFLNVLHSYSRNTRPLLELIKEPSQETLADYAITVHGIKGSTRGIFATILGSKAEALEKAAKEGDFKFVRTNNPAFIAEIYKLINDIEENLDKAAASGGKQEKDRPEEHLLAALLEACNNFDVDEIDKIMEEMENFEYSADGGLAKWLREQVDQMNYKLIAERLSNPAGREE